MRRKLMLVLMGLALMGLLSGCYTNIHKVGTGAAGNNVTEGRQWYVLWGLMPLNQVDTNAMAAGATNYQIKTQMNALDVIFSIVLGGALVNSRTVTLTK